MLQIYYYRVREKYRKSDSDKGVTPLQPKRIDSQTSVYLSRNKEFLEILIGLVGVCVAGVIMYYISTLFRKDEKDDQHDMKLLPQIFGWCSAIFYLSARVPQIIQNYKSRSTKGLSLAMFCFCFFGNVANFNTTLLNGDQVLTRKHSLVGSKWWRYIS
ncbi:9489_t:CDS:2 [Cetraspora pellucida]|uniref:9489_t:CDS:1 n=1 Tax=Cetraspora pellucida TaxID=1433469 RepID=A0A9N9I481_9GLOM|nr:9489_t:CDS:2 [Cetraspora pellucida]